MPRGIHPTRAVLAHPGGRDADGTCLPRCRCPTTSSSLAGDIDPAAVEPRPGCVAPSRGSACGPTASWPTGPRSTGSSNACTAWASISLPSNGVRHVTYRDTHVNFGQTPSLGIAERPRSRGGGSARGRQLEARTVSSRLPAAHLPAHMVRRPRLAEKLEAPGAAGGRGDRPGRARARRSPCVTGCADGRGAGAPGCRSTARHADPEHLLESLLDALDDLAPGVDRRHRPATTRTTMPPSWPSSRAAEHLAARSRATLVLDDVHVIDHSPHADVLAALVEAIAATSLRIVLCSRSDPPVPLHRFRLAGELVELREADLRFNGDEAEQFFARFPQVELDGDQVDRAGRAHRGLGGRPAVRRPVAGRAGRTPTPSSTGSPGSDRHVADFLLDEVLDRQPERRARRSCWPRRCWSGCGPTCASTSPAGPTPPPCCAGSRPRTCSSCRWTTSGAGSATTTCSASCCGVSCGSPGPTWSGWATTGPRPGSASTASPAWPSTTCWTPGDYDEAFDLLARAPAATT